MFLCLFAWAHSLFEEFILSLLAVLVVKIVLAKPVPDHTVLMVLNVAECTYVQWYCYR